MRLKILVSSIFVIVTIGLSAQESNTSKTQRSRLHLGASMNIPTSPTSTNYSLGFGIGQQYEFLLGSHWSLVQSLGFNNLHGKSVTEFYETDNITVEYEYVRAVPLQLGLGFYFGEGQSTFFILFKGGISWFATVTPAYPEVIVNGNTVKEPIQRKELTDSVWFFDPQIGWQFKRLQIRADFQGTVNHDTKINVISLGIAYNVIKP